MTQEVKLKRAQCNYQSENARFLLDCDFSKQYSHYYCKRLEKTKPFLEFNCRSKWDPSIPIYSLVALASVATFYELDDDIEAVLSNQSTTPPESHDGSQGSFKFSKRLRRSSEDTKQSPYPQTSTQKEDIESDISESPIDKRNSMIEAPIPHVPGRSRANECIVIGTIFKRMKMQPDVVRELSQGNFHVKIDRYHGHYTSQDDTLVLEDVDESISLVGNINPKRFVTGIIVALLGIPLENGSQFLVHDVCYAEPNRLILYDETISQKSTDLTVARPLRANGDSIYLMLVSGLGFHQGMGKKSTLTRALQDLIDFIWGGGKFAEDKRSSRVSRILVVGDSLLDDRYDETEEIGSQGEDLAARMRQSRQVKPYSSSIQAVKYMDDFFAQLSKTINVDVMPGPSDPSSHLMPQQPFHPCMFPKSCMFSTFNCTSNPHHAIYNDNVEILATSGQNIDIIRKFSALDDPIEIMKCHLMWGNSAPSAPDNLYSVPYEDDDPHVIDFIPDVYISGCQESFRSDYYYYTSSDSNNSETSKDERDVAGEAGFSGFCAPVHRQVDKADLEVKDDQIRPDWHLSKNRTLLMTIPKFSETLSCVLLNLKNLESHVLSFG